MPLALRLYGQMDQRLQAEGLGIGMVAARGPLTTASWLTGITPLMEGMITAPEQVTNLLDTVTTSLIRWLEAQLDMLRAAAGHSAAGRSGRHGFETHLSVHGRAAPQAHL